jgi:hypothetical protein
MLPLRRGNNGRRIVVAIAAAAMLAMPLASPALARTSVDPSTLNPAPPDFFNAQCYAGAAGTICDLAFADPANPIVDEPSGILCDGRELLFSQNRFVVGKRFYDADGNLVQRHFREWLSGSLTNPDTGLAVLWNQHDTVTHNLSTPGDLDSGTTKVTGLISRFFTADRRTVLVDSGTSLVDTATGEIIHSGNTHPIDDYFRGDASALDAVCAAVD